MSKLKLTSRLNGLAVGLILTVGLGLAIAGIKDVSIQQFPAPALAARTIAINVASVGATSSRDAISFPVPEPWIVEQINGSARTLAGTITTFTMDVKRTAGGVTASVLRTALDMYGTGLASAGTRYTAVLQGDGGPSARPVLFNTGDIVTINYAMVGTNTPLANDVTFEMHYRPTVGAER